MQRSSSDWPEPDGVEGGADRVAEAVSVGWDIGSYCAPENGIYARCHAGWFSRLETSSYARALQGKPIRRFTHFTGHQTVSRELPLEGDFCVRCLQQLNQSLHAAGRNDWIHSTS